MTKKPTKRDAKNGGEKSGFFLRFIKDSSLTLMSLIVTGLIIASFIYIYLALHLPDVEQLRDARLQVPMQIYTADGKLIAEFGEKRRVPVALNKIPKPLIWAVLDTEDARFYSHAGVDFIGLLRAVKTLAITGKKTQGASTITMQVARNFFLNPEKTYARKINEILLALKIDRTFSKDTILELYLNKVYFGQRSYGVVAAAQIYFGKTLDQLTLPEIALIAGLPQAPSRDNPISDPAAAKERRNHVLERMYENGHLDHKTYLAAAATPVHASYHEQLTEVQAPYVAEMARQAMVAEFGDEVYDGGYKVYTTVDSRLQALANRSVRTGVLAYDRRHGYRGAEQNFGVPTQGKLNTWRKALMALPELNSLVPAVVLTVDDNDSSAVVMLNNGQNIKLAWSGLSWARRQMRDNYVSGKPKQASAVVRPGDVIRVERLENGSFELAQMPQVEGSFVALDPNNGAILALVGGFSYGKSNFNRAIDAARQTGSAIKPFIYSSALNKNFTLASIVNDAPLVIADSGNTLWRPQNDDLKFGGPTRLRVAIAKSCNMVSIRLLQAIGVPYAIEYLQRFGFSVNQLPYGLSLALGTSNLSSVQLAGGYAAFANGGYRVTPYFIKEVHDQYGKKIFAADPQVVPNPNSSVAQEGALVTDDTLQKNLADAKGKTTKGGFPPRVITAQNAYVIYDALKDVIRQGTGSAASSLHRRDLAGKTGTTNDQNDAWFCGFNGDLVAIVWVGFDQPHSLYEYGAAAALPIWMSFMGDALQNAPEHDLVMPPNIVKVAIDPTTGGLALSGQQNAVNEVFIKGTEPTTQSDNSALFSHDFDDAASVAQAPPAVVTVNNSVLTVAPKADVAPVVAVPTPAQTPVPATAPAQAPTETPAPAAPPVATLPVPASPVQPKHLVPVINGFVESDGAGPETQPTPSVPDAKSSSGSNGAPVEDDSSEVGLDQLF